MEKRAKYKERKKAKKRRFLAWMTLFFSFAPKLQDKKEKREKYCLASVIVYWSVYFSFAKTFAESAQSELICGKRIFKTI